MGVHETDRVQALRDLQIMGTAPEPHFDAICALAQDLFDVPIVVISFLDEERQWFKARAGIEARECPRSVSLCRFTLADDRILVIEDAAADPRFSSEPLVSGEPHVRFYAGAPLALAPGLPLGTLCLVDVKPRSFTEEDRERLLRLSEVVKAHLRLHEARLQHERDMAELEAKERQTEAQRIELRRREAVIAQTENLANIGTWELDLVTQEVTWSDNLYRIYGLTPGVPMMLQDVGNAHGPEEAGRLQNVLDAMYAGAASFDLQASLAAADGAQRIVRAVGTVEHTDGQPRRAFGILQDITAYMRAVQEAREANRLLVLAEQMAHMGHWRIDLRSGQITGSDEVLRIFGLQDKSFPHSVEEIASLFHPDDRAAVDAVIGNSLSHGHEAEFEARVVWPDGTVRTVLARATSEKSESGVVEAFFGVVSDTTEQKRLDAELKQRTTQLQATLDNMEQGLVMVGADKRVHVANRRALELLDLPASFMEAKPTQAEVLAYQRSRGEFAPAAFGVEADDLSSNRPVHEWERPNGTVLEVRTLSLPEGGVVRTYTDVTARKHAEAARMESESRYRLLAEHSSDVIILGHDDGRRSYISPAMESMLGYAVEEAHALGMRDFIHPDDLEEVYAATRALSRAMPQGSVLFRSLHKMGYYIWTEAALQRVESDRSVTIVTTIRDVTERQLQAEELRRARDAAEEEKRRAERASEGKTEFLASMSHEIRTPLNGILGYADLLIGAPDLSPEHRRHVERIQSAGSALLTVVDDILDFSQIEAGQIVLKTAPFSPFGLVDDAVSIVRLVAERKGLALTVEMDRGLPPALVGDEARLRQVLLNLLNNAIKFTRSGEVRVKVEHESTPEGERVAFFVRDTGIGIPEEKRERLFKRFSQVDGAINREFGGTGLGLAISKQLVDAMGGSIGVESKAGEGSTFFFTVVLRRARAGVALVPDKEAIQRPSRRARILLAEDLEINQDLARAVLEAAGHQVDIVSDGAEALAAVQRRDYDLVLMDVQMPGMDGLTATRLIRALDHPACRVPIVAMTANVLPQQVTACRQAGMSDHVGKPFKQEEIHAAVERALRPTAAPPAPGAEPILVSGPPDLDETVLRELEQIAGAAMVQRLLRQFSDDFESRFLASSEPATRQNIARFAHTTMSSAGMLGLSRLSKACAELEQLCLKDAPIEKHLAEVRALGKAAVTRARAWAERQ